MAGGGSVAQAGTSWARGGGLPPADSAAQLARILNSTDCAATDRERRFLGHVVEEALAGRGDRIKAYSIAVEVFGRDASFDPQSDPIVRIEAGHLRRALERYYLTAGLTDPVLITIPKGGYVPSFSLQPRPVAADAPAIAVPEAAPEAHATQEVAGASLSGVRRWLLLGSLVSVLVAAAGLALWRQSPVTSAAAPEVPRLLVE